MNRHGQKWSEEETILAYYLYCQIPFSKSGKNNERIIELANLLGRTPDSVALKMFNLAHHDIEQQKRNVVAMAHGSKLDAIVTERFANDWDSLAFIAKSIEATIKNVSIDKLVHEIEIDIPEGKDMQQIIKQRVNQAFFRKSVLTAYEEKCCITGIAVPQLLIASHIKPWSVSDIKTERINPRNGLCLNALHDKAFDKGLITVLPDMSIQVSSVLKKECNNSSQINWLIQCDGMKINMPRRFAPAKEFLEYHNDVVYIP